MRQIEVLKTTKEYKQGEIVSLPNNIAHSLIDAGLARIVNYPNKMMEDESKRTLKRRYRTK